MVADLLYSYDGVIPPYLRFSVSQLHDKKKFKKFQKTQR